MRSGSISGVSCREPCSSLTRGSFTGWEQMTSIHSALTGVVTFTTQLLHFGITLILILHWKLLISKLYSRLFFFIKFIVLLLCVKQWFEVIKERFSICTASYNELLSILVPNTVVPHYRKQCWVLFHSLPFITRLRVCDILYSRGKYIQATWLKTSKM